MHSHTLAGRFHKLLEYALQPRTEKVIPMTTKQIDYCIELAHTLNFSRAAENMFVSQPTFSYQIKLLEEEIGFALFDRNGKGDLPGRYAAGNEAGY